MATKKDSSSTPLSSADINSIIWLLILYTLQGVPLGMSAVFPLLLKERGSASYSDLAMFSLCSWPFALKLLWAPIVDGSSLPGIGRRKSWLVPCQLLIAALLYYLSLEYSILLEKNDVFTLTIIFFCLYFLAATQDIAVDGWALTMLSKPNVGYAGTCNSVGQTAGYFLAFSGFFGLSKLGICSLESFMQVWAHLFIVVTGLVAIGKPERDDEGDTDDKSITQIYSDMLKVVSKPSVVDMGIILVTSAIPFIDGIVGVRFQEAGVPSETIALLATLTTPVHIFLPWAISRFVGSKSAPLSNYRKVYPLRIVFQLVSVALVVITPMIVSGTGPYQWLVVSSFYTVVVIGSMISSGLMQVAFVSKMTFFAKVSDPAIGGTYMTVLNTISNIGGNVASQINYRLVDFANLPELGIDGFYVVVAFATIYGFVWIRYFGTKLTKLERLPNSQWRIGASKRR